MAEHDYLYPLAFQPVYKDYIWGGGRIPKIYDRPVPDGVYAESWEVSTRDEGMSVVRNGPLAGRSLKELVDEFGKRLLGHSCRSSEFPLLIKIIDSAQKLSVQVHPNDMNAAAVGGEAKTEMWYVLGDDPDAMVYAGLKPGVNEQTIKKALAEGTMAENLQPLPVSSGDVVFIPGGRVHAIGEHCLLLEIQQSSNTTYRLYDWDRVGKDGKPRELHVDKALKVIRWDDNESPLVDSSHIKSANLKNGNTELRMISTDYFCLDKLLIQTSLEVARNDDSFSVFFVEDGNVAFIHQEEMILEVGKGTSVLVPANMPKYQISPDKSATLLRIYLPES